MAALSAKLAAAAVLPWTRGSGGGLVVVGLRGASATAGAGGCSLLPPRRWKLSSSSSLPQPESVETSSDEESGGGGTIDWDSLGFALTATDYMYVMRCSPENGAGGGFSRGELSRYGNLELSPASGALNYGQGVFEGMKAYRGPGRSGSSSSSYALFRPELNAARMRHGAARMCMPAPSVEQLVRAVKRTVLANARWVPPRGKGALYLRPLLVGSGPVLGVAPAPSYTFLVYASPVGDYFKGGRLVPISLVVDDGVCRAAPGGTGGVKTIANYAPVLRAQMDAKSKGFTDVLYLDAVHGLYIEEASSSNVFVVTGGVVATPPAADTILPGITRRSVLQLAADRGYKVEERLITVDELAAADEVFCTGTAIVVAPVSAVTYRGQRYEFRTGDDTVSQELYTALTSIQTGLAEDKRGWTVAVD